MNAASFAAPASSGAGYARKIVPEGDETFYLPLGNGGQDGKAFTVTLTQNEGTRTEAIALINRRYAWRGYGDNQKLSGRQHESTFVARSGPQLFGTLTLCADSDRGLAVDETFADEMQYFRRKPNSRLCELKKFAMDYSDSTKQVLGALFHFVFIYGKALELGSDLFIEVNPRHVRFYENALSFQCVGGLKVNASVNAPSQLMWLSVERIPELIATGGSWQQRHSLYKYFYNLQQQGAILGELQSRGFGVMVD